MHRWKIIGLILIIVIIIASGGVIVFKNKTNADLDKNHQRLIREEYNTTLDFRYFSKVSNKIDVMEFLLPEGETKSISIDIWNRALLGSIKIEILDGKQNVLFRQFGRNMNRKNDIKLLGGSYQLKVDFTSAFFGALGLGLKGDIVWCQSLDKSRFTKISPGPEDEFHWPYLLYVPQEIKKARLMIIPNNTGEFDDFRIHEEKAKAEILKGAKLADRLGVPLLVPVFPRLKKEGKIYTHALDRDCLIIDRNGLKRLDLQLIEMINNARARLNQQGVTIQEKVFLFGFSASGMFVNRFTILHPEQVHAVACGAPGGWPIAPSSKFQGKKLRYPIGIADISELTGMEINIDEIRKVPMFMFLGEEDNNDSVIYRDSYEKEDETLILALFGKTPQQRWKIAEELYQSAGCVSLFKTYQGVGHAITPEIQQDIVEFFLNQ